MKHFIFLILTQTLLVNLTLASDWKLEKNSSGIKIYTRITTASDVKEFKAVTTINADKHKVSNVVFDVNDYVKWFPDIMESKLLKVVSSTERNVYYKLDVPWPADDRDAVLKLKMTKTPNEITIKMSSLSNYKAKTSGAIRINHASGSWKFTTTQDKQTKVTYQFLTDPGGSLPTWIINMMVVDNPYQTLVALKNKVE